MYAGHLENNNRSSLLPRAVLRITGPLLDISNRLLRLIRESYENYINLIGVNKENELLRRRISQLTWELNSYQEMALANERYRKLFEFRFTSGFSSLVAKVIARDPSAWSSSLILDRGDRDGVICGMCVVTDMGVVGQIVSVTATTSQVQTLLHPDSSAAVLLQQSRTHALLSGQGEGREFLLRFIDKSAQTQPAEVVVTSGLDRVFPHGLVVGIVTSIEKLPESLFQAVTVRPSVEFSRLEEVAILLESDDFLPAIAEPRDDLATK